jgi:hypothetical protein
MPFAGTGHRRAGTGGSCRVDKIRHPLDSEGRSTSPLAPTLRPPARQPTQPTAEAASTTTTEAASRTRTATAVPGMGPVPGRAGGCRGWGRCRAVRDRDHAAARFRAARTALAPGVDGADTKRLSSRAVGLLVGSTPGGRGADRAARARGSSATTARRKNSCRLLMAPLCSTLPPVRCLYQRSPTSR